MPAQSCTQSLEVSASHVPQLSSILSPFGIPAQSAQDESSPPQIPHSSSTKSPPHDPEQSCTQSLEVSASHVPQLSSILSPFGIPAQSAQDESSPPQIPHSSSTKSPPHDPEQSCTQSLAASASQSPQLSSYPSPKQTPAQSASGPSTNDPLLPERLPEQFVQTNPVFTSPIL